MKKFWMIAALALCAAWIPAAELGFVVGDRGQLSISLDGKTVFDREGLQLMNATWGTVSAPLAVPVDRKDDDGVVFCRWATDRGEVTRTVVKLPDGRLKINWSIKFLNGIPEGRYVELTYRAPLAMFRYPEGGEKRLAFNTREMTLETVAGKLFLNFSGASLPWAFEDMRSTKWHKEYRLILAWPYDPAVINLVESEIVISAEKMEGK